MATIEIFKDWDSAPEVVDHDGTIGDWLVVAYGETGLPDNFTLYRGSVCAANECDLDAPADWADCDGVFIVALQPAPAGGAGRLLAGAVSWVWTASVALLGKLIEPLIPEIPGGGTGQAAQKSANNSLDKRQNEARVNQRIEDIFGQERATLSLLTVPRKFFEDGIEYEEFFAAVGRGQYQFDEAPRDGDVPFTKLPGSCFATYPPGTSPNGHFDPDEVWGDGMTDPYPYIATVIPSKAVTGEVVRPFRDAAIDLTTATITSGGTITVTTGDDLTTLFAPDDYVELSDVWVYEDTGTELLLRGVSGTYRVFAVTTSVLSIYAEGSNWAFVSGSCLSSFWSNGYGAYEGKEIYLTEQPKTVETIVPASMQIPGTGASLGPYITPDATDTSGSDPYRVKRYYYNFVAASGLYDADGNAVSITVRILIKELDSDLEETGNSVAYYATLTGEDDSPYGWTRAYLDPFPGSPASHTVTRITDEVEGGVDEVRWRDLYTSVTDQGGLLPEDALDYGDITMVYVKVKASQSALKVKERRANALVTRKVPSLIHDWDDVSELSANRRVDILMRAIAIDPKIGRLSPEMVDIESLSLAATRQQLYFGGTQYLLPAHTFDDTNITFEESIQLLASACFLQVYRAGSVIKAVADLPTSQSTALFCHRNKHPGSDTESRRFSATKQQDGVEVTYKNLSSDSFETHVLDTSGGTAPSNPKEVDIPGIRSEAWAAVHAKRIVNRLKYARRSLTFDALSDGRLLVPSQRIDVVPNVVPGTMDGEVRGVSGLTLRLSNPVELGTGDHSIVLAKRDGTTEGIAVDSVSSDGYFVTLATAPSESVYTGCTEDRTRFWFGPDSEQDALAWRVEEISPQSVDKVTVSAINYSDNYYDGDLE